MADALERRKVRLAPEIARLALGDDDKLYLQELAREILAGRVVLFAGAGMSLNAKSCDGGESRIPAWWALAKELRAQLGAKIKDEHDVLKIADYFEAKYGRSRLLDAVLTALRDDEHLPGRAHDLVVELNFREILTTNFDTLLERAFRQLHIQPQVVVCDSDLTRRRRHPRILKVNGCVTSPATIVLTGNDFLAYPRQHPLIEAFVTKCFVESTVLFVGFSLDDPAFRILNEKVSQALGPHCRQAYSLQFGVSEEQRKHWFSRKVQLVDLAPGEPSPEYERILFDTLRTLAAVKRRMSPLRHQPGRRQRRPPDAHWELVEALCDRDLVTRRRALARFSEQPRGPWSFDGSFDALAAADMTERRRFLTYAALFAPLPALVKLVGCWLVGGEAGVVRKELHPFHPTPEEYRIPLLGFCGVLERSPGLFLQAADSLWARQLEAAEHDLAGDGAPEHGHDALDVAYRFRYLIAAGERLLKAGDPLSGWRGAELQLERLEKMLSRLFLAGDEAPEDSAAAVRAVLDELLGGWVFGSPKAPESLVRAWNLTRRDVGEGRSDAVPWELLAVLTLTIDGELRSYHFDLLQAAWYRRELDLTFFVEHLARRLDGGADAAWKVAMPGAAAAGESHQERYERGLAELVGWLCQLAAGEEPSSPERQHLVEQLCAPFRGWRQARQQHPGLRKPLLRAWGALAPLAAERFGAELREWSQGRLSPGAAGLAELALLLPEDGEAVDPALVDRLLCEIADGDVAFKVRRWLLDRCEGWPLRKKTRATLGRLVAGWLRRQAASGSLGWLSLAADVQRLPELRREVEAVLKREDEAHPETLFLFVKRYLLPVLAAMSDKLAQEEEDADAEAMKEGYGTKVAAYHQYFAPFAEAMDEELLARVMTDLDPGRTYTREATAQLLAALLQHAPETLRKAHGEAWLADLERLIAAGATGEGALGPLVAQLAPATVEQLQDNLATMAAQREGRDDHRPVAWVVATLAAAPPGSVPALEEELVELAASPSREVAEASLAGILARQDLADFVERHRRRLRRVRAVVVVRGGYRRHSTLAARLAQLDEHLER